MKIIDASVLQHFRDLPFCELCAARSPGKLAPHHVLGRGHGGCWRADIPEAIVALCPGLWKGQCHDRYGDDPDYRERFLQIIARREGFLNGGLVLEYLYAVRNAPKGGPLPVR